MIRNFAGSQLVAAGLEAEGFTPTGPKAAYFVACAAASFTLCRFGKAAGFAKAARPARAGDVTCFGEWPGFDEPLKTSDSQPASLASIGNSTKAAIAATTARWRGPKPAFVKVLPDDGNAYLPRVIRCLRSRDSMAALAAF
jgi:hypothetical protein